MLHPHLMEPGVMAGLAAAWQAQGSLRLEPFLADDVAGALAGALRGQEHTLQATPPSTFMFQYWAHAFVPEPACDHVLCRFGRWLWSKGAAWVSTLTGLELGPPPDRVLMATLYSKGCYLDAHNDHDGHRQVAYVLGLTADAWPAEHGGYLEFLAVEGAAIRVTERRAPGWNTLDLFDVRAPVRLHRVPMLTHAAERRAITGWLYERPHT